MNAKNLKRSGLARKNVKTLVTKPRNHKRFTLIKYSNIVVLSVQNQSLDNSLR